MENDPVGKFSASFLEMSRGVEVSALLSASPDPDHPDGWKLEPGKAQSSTTVSEGARQCEVYCLTMQVTHSMDSLDTDVDVPPHSWLEGIARDMTEYCLGIPPRVTMVELLNDLEYLVF